MPPLAAFLVWLGVIVYLFVRDQRNHPDISPAIWIPIVWLILLGSRGLSSWLSLGTAQAVTVEMYAEGNPLDRYFLILMFVIATAIVSKRNLRWSSILQENRLFFLFVLYCLLSVTWSEYPIVALKRLIRFSGMLPMALVVLSERLPIEATMAVIRRTSYLLVTLSFLFIRYFPQYGRYYNPFTWEPAYCGVCGNKNELGMICVLASLVFLMDLKKQKHSTGLLPKSVDFWTTMVLLLITAYLLRIAQSATSLFCAIVGSLILLGTSLPALRRNPQGVVYRVVGLSALFAIAELLFKVNTLIIGALGRDPTLTNRSYVWSVLLGMGTNPIVGTGFGSFWTTGRMEYLWSLDIRALQAHSGYIETYLNLGIIGVLFLLAFLGRCFRLVAKEMPSEFFFNQLRLAVLVVFALTNYTEAIFPLLGLLSAVFFLMLVVIHPAKQNSQLDIVIASSAKL